MIYSERRPIHFDRSPHHLPKSELPIGIASFIFGIARFLLLSTKRDLSCFSATTKLNNYSFVTLSELNLQGLS